MRYDVTADTSGLIRERTATLLTAEVSLGKITLPMALDWAE